MENNKRIDEMSIAELKAALDFVREDIKDTEDTAKEKNIKPESIASLKPLKAVECSLYNKLLNKTRDLYTDPTVMKTL